MVRTFKDFIPLPREDATSWETAIIQEASVREGPWVTIDTVALSADADPAHPQPRSFTVDTATLEEGWYRIVFEKDDDQSSTDPIHYLDEVNPDYLPSVDGVASLIRARTKDEFGNEIGTFTTATRPSNAQAIEAINHAGNLVMAALGDDPPARAVASAREMVKIRAAMVIELSYFSEQIELDQSPYDRLKEQYDEELERVMQAIEDLGREGDVGPGDVPDVSYSFPLPVWLRW